MATKIKHLYGDNTAINELLEEMHNDIITDDELSSLLSHVITDYGASGSVYEYADCGDIQIVSKNPTGMWEGVNYTCHVIRFIERLFTSVMYHVFNDVKHVIDVGKLFPSILKAMDTLLKVNNKILTVDIDICYVGSSMMMQLEHIMDKRVYMLSELLSLPNMNFTMRRLHVSHKSLPWFATMIVSFYGHGLMTDKQLLQTMYFANHNVTTATEAINILRLMTI